MKISKISIIAALTFIASFRMCTFTYNDYRTYSMFILLFLIPFLLLKRAKVHWSAVVFVMLFLMTSWGKDGFYSAFVYCQRIIAVFLLFDYARKKRQLLVLFDTFIAMLVLFQILTVFNIMIYGGSMPIFKTEVLFFGGNKFQIAYLNLLLLSLVNFKRQKAKKDTNKKRTKWDYFLLICIIYSYYMNVYTECSTGIVAMVIYFATYLISNKDFRKLLTNRWFPATYVVAGSAIVISTDFLLSNVFVQNIVTNVLGKSTTLSGRTVIYSRLPLVFQKNLLTGYGYLNPIVSQVTQLGNAQNGIVEIMAENGLITVIAFLILLSMAIYDNREISNSNWCFIAMAYAFMSCAFIEICFDINIIWVFAIIISMSAINDSEPDACIEF